MQSIVEMRFGAHLYGTETEQSDLDLKAVYLPAARDILLQRASPVITETRPKAFGEKNTAADVDFEAFSLQRYMELLAEGQPVAIDMLFAPDAALTSPSDPLWREIQANADRFLSTRPSVFLRYCRQQANRFGIKGSRVTTARRVLSAMAEAESRLGTTAKVMDIGETLAALSETLDHCTLIDLPTPNGERLRHVEICDKKVPFTASMKTAREIVQRLVDEYGKRALEAERNQGIDWKALSHAVRVGREALELFETGRIVFPLAAASHLRQIKCGEIAYSEVAVEIESLLEQVEAAAKRSRLPSEPDVAAMEGLVAKAYRRQVEAGL